MTEKNNTLPALQTTQQQSSTPVMISPPYPYQVGQSSEAPHLSPLTSAPGASQRLYYITNRTASISSPTVTLDSHSAQRPPIPQQSQPVLYSPGTQQSHAVKTPSSSSKSRDMTSPSSFRSAYIPSTTVDRGFSGSSFGTIAPVVLGPHLSGTVSGITELLEPEFPEIGGGLDDDVIILDNTTPTLSEKSTNLGKRSTSTRPISSHRTRTSTGSENAWSREALQFLVDWANVEENWTRLRRRRNVGQEKKSTLYIDISEQLLKETGVRKDALAIKNKLADMSRSFNKALKFHSETGQGDRNEQSFKDAVMQRCSFFYDVYDLWSSSLKTSTDTIVESTDDVASLSEATNSILGDITTAKESDYESDVPLKRRKTKSRVSTIRSKIDELVRSDKELGGYELPGAPQRARLSLDEHIELQEKQNDVRLKELAETQQTKREEEKRRGEEEKRRGEEERTKQEMERTKQKEAEAKKAQIELDTLRLKMAMQDKGYRV